MSNQEIEYDVFLSHASEDTEFCEELAERLRNEGVKVWFDKWELKPGDHLLDRLNNGLERSQKMVSVWSESYFRDNKVWTLAESYSKQHSDILSRERLLIPILKEKCDIKPTLLSIVYVDFRNKDDYDFRFRQLLEALDFPKFKPEYEERTEFREHEIDISKRGIKAYEKGKSFEDEVAKLYLLSGYETKQDIKIAGMQIHLFIQKDDIGVITQAIIECKDNKITSKERDQILAQQNVVQKKFPAYRWIAVSSIGFAPDTRTTLEESGITCITYSELLHKLIPIDNYVEKIISKYEEKIKENWNGEDWFIRPDIVNDITYETLPGITRISKFLGDEGSNFLTILGDLGTGKSTLAEFLAYNLARSFRDDPIRHPAPVLIPLKEVRKEVSLEGIIISHFNKFGITGLNFQRFEYLVRSGKIIIFFDAFDEMADRVRWDVTKANFYELRRAAEEKGKVILTCRTHYFKDRNEQVKLIGEGPKLSEIETELYKELRKQSGAEVIYLQEFNDEQIKEYLKKARPYNFDEDCKKINEIYNLKDLAHRPLLLDMIVRSLPKLNVGEDITAASLYEIYTNIWIEREEKKGRILDKNIKRQLMHELAWRMWNDEKNEIQWKELIPFVEKLKSDKVLEFEDEEIEDIAKELQMASFLKRDDKGYFSFMHRSFMEFFLARKILECISIPENRINAENVLNTRRLDRKAVYFLSLLDKNDIILQPLQDILKNNYIRNISENALQILYWSGRVKNKAEEKVDNVEKLREILSQRIPQQVNLSGADLQEIVLECADLTGANFENTDLTKANLNNTLLDNSNFRKAKLVQVKAVNVHAINADFFEADLEGIVFNNATLKGSNINKAIFDRTGFLFTDIAEIMGLKPFDLQVIKNWEAVIQNKNAFEISSIAYNPTGDLISASGVDGLIYIYRIIDNRLLHVLEGHKSEVRSVHFSPYGNILASGSDDRTIKLWEVKSGKNICTLMGHDYRVNSVYFSPVGNILASGSDDETIRFWNIKTGKNIRTIKGHRDKVNSVQFSPEGNILASGSDDETIRFWNIITGKNILTIKGHIGKVNSVQFSPDGDILASGSSDGIVRLWDVNSGENIHVFDEHIEIIISISFSPNRHILACGSSDRIIRLLDIDTGKSFREIEGHKGKINSIHFSPDGKVLASGGSDKSIRLWDVKTGKNIRIFEGHSFKVNSIHFSPDGKVLASGNSDKSIRLWDVSTGKKNRAFKGLNFGGNSVVFSPDGKMLVCGFYDNTIQFWNISTGKNILTIEGHNRSVNSIHFSPDGKILASGSSDETIRLWDVSTGKNILTIEGHNRSVNSIHFSPDGKILASGSSDKTIGLWDVSTGKNIRINKEHNNYVKSIHFSPDGNKLASGSFDGTIKLWNVKTGKEIHSLIGHKYGVNSIHFSPDGNTLASGSDDHSVRLWNIKNGECISILESNLGPVYSAVFAPSGKYLVAAGAAGRLQFWDVNKQETFLYRYSFGPNAWLDLLPDGRFDASPEGMRYLCYTKKDELISLTAEELVKEFYNPDAVKKTMEAYL